MPSLRSSLERLTRDWQFTRHLPAEFSQAPIRVSTAGGLRYLAKPMARVDPELLDLARAWVQVGSTVWDVGANVGLFSVAAANLAGSGGAIYSFEADTWLVGLLRATARMQGKDAAPIEVIPAAVSDTAGLARFCIAQRARSSNHLEGFGQSQTGGTRHTQTVVSVTLDGMLDTLKAPDVLKVDVEGAEAHVLRGATRVLAEARPTLICEVAEESALEVSERLKGHRYVMFDGQEPASVRRPIERARWSTIAIPAERAPG